eukprot:TRINITY_DN15424_c0_g1_i1.p1 TRINITY_DN15424_c0_g1~~TRINITY_DN15424_c0_g1_i1.p1  ORF type:complete len:288 (+),score=37.85 TRINITY_DN15424_c0_g1_i1:73-936(+)
MCTEFPSCQFFGAFIFACVNSRSMSKQYSLVKEGKFDIVLDALRDSSFVTEQDENRWEPLHWAAFYGSLEGIQALLEAGASINARTTQGFTPVYISTRQNQLEAISLLIKKGANVNLQDGHQQTPLHRACEYNQEAAATILITEATNIDVNLQDLMGRTALHWSVVKDMHSVAELLLNYKAKLLKTNGGEDALHWAARCGDAKSVGLLLNYFSNINVYVKNEKGESAIELAHSPEIRELMEAHALSLGYTGDGKAQIHNLSHDASGTAVRKVSPAIRTKKLNITLKK